MEVAVSPVEVVVAVVVVLTCSTEITLTVFYCWL